MKEVNGEKWLIVKVKHTMVDLAGACSQFTSFLIFPFCVEFLVPNHTDC